MWHWLQKRLPSANNLWVRLAVFSCTAHLFVFCALFLMGSNGESRSFDLAVQRDLSNARIVLLPLYRVVPQEMNKNFLAGGGGKGGVGGAQAIQTQTAQSTRPATRLFHDTRAYTAKKKAAAQRVAAKKAKAEQERLKREEAKKKKLEALRQAELEKEEAARKKAERQAELDKKAELNKAELKKQSEEKPKIETPAVPVEQPSAGKPSAGKPSAEQSTAGSSDAVTGGNAGTGGDNVYYVGRDELEQYRENTELREALADVWHPPFGIEPEAPCKLAVVVDKNGSATRVTVESSSGVLVYDSAAQAALFAAEYPEREHGKVLHITFR